jgi:hypothetical protein
MLSKPFGVHVILQKLDMERQDLVFTLLGFSPFYAPVAPF